MQNAIQHTTMPKDTRFHRFINPRPEDQTSNIFISPCTNNQTHANTQYPDCGQANDRATAPRDLRDDRAIRASKYSIDLGKELTLKLGDLGRDSDSKPVKKLMIGSTKASSCNQSQCDCNENMMEDNLNASTQENVSSSAHIFENLNQNSDSLQNDFKLPHPHHQLHHHAAHQDHVQDSLPGQFSSPQEKPVQPMLGNSSIPETADRKPKNKTKATLAAKTHATDRTTGKTRTTTTTQIGDKIAVTINRGPGLIRGLLSKKKDDIRIRKEIGRIIRGSSDIDEHTMEQEFVEDKMNFQIDPRDINER